MMSAFIVIIAALCISAFYALKPYMLSKMIDGMLVSAPTTKPLAVAKQLQHF